MNVREIPLSQIQPDPQQPRKDMAETELNELAGNIRKQGLLQPIIVFASGDHFIAVDGHRRLSASKKLNQPSISAIVLPERPSDDQLLLTQLATNMIRVDLTPIEQAQALQRLQQMKGWSNTELAEQLQYSKSKVTRLLALLKLPAEAQELVKAGTLKPSTAYEISRAKTPSEQEQLLMAASSDAGLRRDQATNTVNRKQAASHLKDRVSFRLSHAEMLIATETPTSLDDVIENCQELMRECKRAAKLGLNISTLSQVLKDQNEVKKVAELAGGANHE